MTIDLKYRFRPHIWHLFLSILFLMIAIWGGDVSADQDIFKKKSPVKSACEIDYPPFCFVVGDDQAKGFSVELLEAALKAMGRAVTFETGPWIRVRSWLERGEVQALPMVGRTPEREPLFDFTFPYMSLHGAIVVRADTTNIHNLEDLRGRQVAVMKGDNAEEFLQRGERGIKIHSLPTFNHALRELSQGFHDAVVIQRLVALRLVRHIGLSNLKIVKRPIEGFRQDFCFAVKEGDRDTLALLNEGLSLVMADGTYRHLHAKWFAALQLPSHNRIIIGGDDNYPPFEYLDENGLPAGFIIDISRGIAREVGLDVTFRLGPWANVIDGLEQGRIDAIQGMFYSPDRDLKFDFTQAHSVNNYVIAVRKGQKRPPTTLGELKGRTIVVQDGDIMHDFVVKNGLEDLLAVKKNQEESLRELAAGKYDCALVPRIPALYLIKKNGWKNLVLGQKPLLTTEYCYAVPDNQKALLAQFSEGLKLLNENGEYRRIYEKWLGIYAHPSLRFASIFRYVAMVAFPLLLLLLIFFLWSWSLRKQVASRTAELTNREKRIAHLNRVLRGIRDVNQLIVREQNFQNLIQEGCRMLVENRGYESALIVLIDENNLPVFQAASGIAASSKSLNTFLQNHQLPPCCKVARTLGKVVLMNDNPCYCEICPIVGDAFGTQPMCASLIHDGRIYGYLAVALDHELNVDTEEQTLFTEMVEDIAYALYVLHSDQARKVSEQKQKSLEGQLIQARKMESVGRLAGGVAHDYNNMLSIIVGYTEMSLEDVAPGDPLHTNLEQILSAAKRSADITRQLLAFARKQPIAPKVLQLNVLVENMLKMLQRLIGEDIDLAWRPGAHVWSVKIDPSQVDQILVNLCINARDAISGVGKIIIETRNVQLDKDYCMEHAGFAQGEYILLTVSDNGMGMAPETLDKAFEPFFTTKQLGKGTGLGLATVYGIVKQNNGFANVYSELKEGTTIKIYLPRYAGQTPGGIIESAVEMPLARGETLLIVEDDDAILTLGQKMLGNLGYTVFAANSPGDAMALARKNAGGIDLLITDVVMPEMNGRDLANQLQTLYPGLQVLFMSGYTANVIAHRGVLDEGVNFIPKPFSQKELAVKVRDVLGR